ncbi:MAG: ATP synthase F1 subunit epsilon [Oscillospiraceae bacterium]|nr:ATP synthase F1 subunit epsilon [Oscillospiraceae bacterium]
MAGEFQLHILSPERDFYQGPCSSLVIPTLDGEYGILPGHSPLVAALVPGLVTVTFSGGGSLTAVVSHGLIRFAQDDAMILVGSAEKPEEIDEARARRAAERARAELLQKHSWHEHLQTQANLSRAMTRLKAASKGN